MGTPGQATGLPKPRILSATSATCKCPFIHLLLNPLIPTTYCAKEEVPQQNYMLCKEASTLEICHFLVLLVFCIFFSKWKLSKRSLLAFSSDAHNHLQIYYILPQSGLFQAKVTPSSILALPVPSSILLHWEQNQAREHNSILMLFIC